MHTIAIEFVNQALGLGLIRHMARPQPLHDADPGQQAVFDALPLLIAVLDPQGRVVQANAACERFAAQNGFACVQGVVGAPYRDVLEVISAAQPLVFQAALAGIEAVSSGLIPHFQMDHCVPSPTQDHWFTMQVTPVSGMHAQVVVSHHDISQVKAAELASMAMANVDELTGALSRRKFLAVAEQELSRAVRYSMPLMVLMLDLDHFKQINDTHCHAGGDAVLKGFVQTVTAVLRTQDVMGRLGGEEFCVLLPNTTRKGGYALAQRIVDTVAISPVHLGWRTIDYTVSIGASCLAGEAAFADLLRRADVALYRAKNAGRNRVATEPALMVV